MPFDRLKACRQILGDPASYIPAPDDKPTLIEWAIASGIAPVAVHAMTFVDLVNLYHGKTQPPSAATDVQRATSDAVLQTLASVSAITEQTVRALVREELADHAPPRLEVVTPRGSVILDGLIHYCTPLVIRVASLGHAIMLVGPAGCGKTTIGEHAAKALGLPFYITNTINDTHELMGFTDGHGTYHATPFRTAFEHGGLWIADEVDAWNASALLAANSALANGFASFPDRTAVICRHADFRMVATANTYGSGADRVYVGRNELDAASLDRFATIAVDYDVTLERAFAGNQHKWLERVWSVRKAVAEKKIRHVVSSRAITMGAAALSIGIEWSDVEALYLFKGMSERDREKL